MERSISLGVTMSSATESIMHLK